MPVMVWISESLLPQAWRVRACTRAGDGVLLGCHVCCSWLGKGLVGGC